MTLPAEVFEIHDVSAFPLIRFRSERAVEGYAAQWMREMDALLAHGAAFALLYATPRNEGAQEAHEDRKQRGIWLKQNKTALARLCAGLASVVPDAVERDAMRKMAAGTTRAFGVKQMVEATEEEAVSALALALKLQG